MLRKIVFTLRQVWQSWLFALESVVLNKLRTGLSLLGITIGIFAIITVFTLVDSLELKIRSDIGKLGSNVLFVGKWPWSGGGEWWRYVNRPQVSIGEYQEMRRQLPSAEAVALSTSFYRTVRRGNAYLNSTEIIGATYEYDRMRQVDIVSGRYFTPYEANQGSRVAIIGAQVAETLFENSDPLGQEFRLGGTKISVIGVFARNGDDMTGLSLDESVLIPFGFARTFINLRWAGMEMSIKGRDDADIQELKAEVTSVMRRLRRLPPQAEDNFAVNELSILNNQLDQMFGTISLAGGIIGIFSILVGGFGVANIMFVSVRERTSQIGIQKALGARPYFILLQFVFESVLLSVAGGVIGLLLVFAGITIVNSSFDILPLVLTPGNITLGLLISSVVGAVAGIFPAWSAARMEPVKAIFNT